ncbi:MAG: YigZ family protein [Bacillales bacterium]|jgi:putative IMPACT (imprinted ancient) family translation regulator|nr:YigZ family protein [Bacillales bacterium]
MYKVINKESNYKLNIQNSIFLGFSFKAELTSIDTIINKIKKEYSDATHIVYAFLDNSNYKYTDDQEPSKSAGFQLLNLLKQKQIYNSLLVVVRYFGGKKLGKSNLSKAYYECGLQTLYLSGTNTNEIINVSYISTTYTDFNKISHRFPDKIYEIKYEEKVYFLLNTEYLNYLEPNSYTLIEQKEYLNSTLDEAHKNK